MAPQAAFSDKLSLHPYIYRAHLRPAVWALLVSQFLCYHLFCFFILDGSHNFSDCASLQLTLGVRESLWKPGTRLCGNCLASPLLTPLVNLLSCWRLLKAEAEVITHFIRGSAWRLLGLSGRKDGSQLLLYLVRKQDSWLSGWWAWLWSTVLTKAWYL